MTVPFAELLLAMIVGVVLVSIGLTLSRYGRRMLALRDELRDCREFIEMRLSMRASGPPQLVAIARPAPLQPQVAAYAALRAAA